MRGHATPYTTCDALYARLDDVRWYGIKLACLFFLSSANDVHNVTPGKQQQFSR